MNILPNQDLSLLRSRDLVHLKCEFCHKTFQREKHFVQAVLKKRTKEHETRIKFKYCSRKCQHLAQFTGITIVCKTCGKCAYKEPCKMSKSKSGRFFCSSSCAATYTNTHKTKGIRRSKLESWIEKQLKDLFPRLDISFNDKQTIEKELDIYIPSLSLAFELNGIHHKKPIFGKIKLAKIQKNDEDKLNRCLEKGITLISIDTSSQLRFTPETSIVYLNKIIDRIKRGTGREI